MLWRKKNWRQFFIFTITQPQNYEMPGIIEGKRSHELAVNNDKWILFNIFGCLKKSTKTHWLKSWQFVSWKLNLKSSIISKVICLTLVDDKNKQISAPEVRQYKNIKFQFYDNKFFRAHWLIFIVNKRTDTWLHNLCDAATSESRRFDSLLW